MWLCDQRLEETKPTPCRLKLISAREIQGSLPALGSPCHSAPWVWRPARDIERTLSLFSLGSFSSPTSEHVTPEFLMTELMLLQAGGIWHPKAPLRMNFQILYDLREWCVIVAIKQVTAVTLGIWNHYRKLKSKFLLIKQGTAWCWGARNELRRHLGLRRETSTARTHRGRLGTGFPPTDPLPHSRSGLNYILDEEFEKWKGSSSLSGRGSKREVGGRIWDPRTRIHSTIWSLLLRIQFIPCRPQFLWN